MHLGLCKYHSYLLCFRFGEKPAAERKKKINTPAGKSVGLSDFQDAPAEVLAEEDADEVSLEDDDAGNSNSTDSDASSHAEGEEGTETNSGTYFFLL